MKCALKSHHVNLHANIQDFMDGGDVKWTFLKKCNCKDPVDVDQNVREDVDGVPGAAVDVVQQDVEPVIRNVDGEQDTAPRHLFRFLLWNNVSFFSAHIDPFPALNQDVKNNAEAFATFKKMVRRLSIQFNTIPGDPVEYLLVENHRKFFARTFGAQCYLAACDGDNRSVVDIIQHLHASKSHLP